MLSALLLSLALLGADDPPAVSSTAIKPPLETYRAALAETGKNADAHVRLALWCEAHGLTAERFKHLSLAVLYDPSNALARGLMGLVGYHGKWNRPDVIGQQIQNDPAHQVIVKEYLDRRARTPETADSQMKLAAWCDENGLREQAIAHYSAVTRMNPARDSAWKHLGYKKQGDRWVKPDEAAMAKQEATRQKQADQLWKPKLERLRDGLESKVARRRTNAELELTGVTDPRALPMIWAIFSRGGERQQIAVVQMLGQIDGPAASNALAALAVLSSSSEVRRRAVETLTRRDPRDVIGRLIGLIRKPLKYQVRHVNGPGSPGELFAEGERFNIQRFYHNILLSPLLAAGRLYTPDVPFDPFSPATAMMATLGSQFSLASFYMAGNLAGAGGVVTHVPASVPTPVRSGIAAHPGQSMAGMPQNATAILSHLTTNPAHRNTNAAFGLMLTAQSQAAQRDWQIEMELERVHELNQTLEQILAMDVQFLETINAQINLFDDRTLPLLTAITGQSLGVEPEKWRNWWADQLGYAYQSPLPEIKPTYTDVVMTAHLGLSHSCFAVGTPVQTIEGTRSIESIRVGDRVLSQSTLSGQLAFQPVVATHLNPPAPTLRIVAGGESIVATGIHRFWNAGKGWTMARELKRGDRLRMVGGTVKVESITSDKTQPVYNLDVADNRDFFVGTQGLLVHDFGFVQPVLEPFDQEPVLGSLAAPASK
jgi:tetratricopeptide (TPR) repeat protein